MLGGVVMHSVLGETSIVWPFVVRRGHSAGMIPMITRAYLSHARTGDMSRSVQAEWAVLSGRTSLRESQGQTLIRTNLVMIWRYVWPAIVKLA